MQKKIISKIAALTIAGLTALPSLSLVSSANLTKSEDGKSVSGTIYYVTYLGDDHMEETHYFITSDAASAAAKAAGVDKPTVNSMPLTSKWTAGTTIYIYNDEISSYNNWGSSAASYLTAVASGSGNNNNNNNPSSNNGYYNNHSYASDTIYHSTSADRYYPNRDAYLNDPANTDSDKYTNTGMAVRGAEYNYATGFVYFDVKSGYYTTSASNYTIYIGSGSGSSSSSSSSGSSTYPWYSTYTGRYYRTREDALAASQTSSQVYYVGNNYYGYPYYSTYTQKYYSTYEAARAASQNPSQVIYVGNNYNYNYNRYPYYSTYTGQYYSTYEAARAASQNSSQVVYVGDGYYDYYNNYYDLYYYYNWLANNDSTGGGSNTSSNSITISSTSNWTTLANRIRLAAAGRSFTVNMKDETVIPASIFTAVKGKDVTVSFKLDNGVVYTINGKSVTSAKDVNIITTYNTDRIPESLVKKAYQKFNAVSTAQISVNSNSFGAKVGITVKFAAKRAGCQARLYRYNPDKRSLSLVDTSIVESSGQCKFEGVAKGGDFVIVLS